MNKFTIEPIEGVDGNYKKVLYKGVRVLAIFNDEGVDLMKSKFSHDYLRHLLKMIDEYMEKEKNE